MAGIRKAHRPVIDCPHDGRHAHGTRTGYVVDGCRCDPCTESTAEYERKRSKLRAYGRWEGGMVSAASAREHLRTLRAAGIGYRHIAALAGVNHSTVVHILNGSRERIKGSTAKKILAVGVDQEFSDGRKIDGTGTRRRLQALTTVGWSPARLAGMLGLNKATVLMILAGSGTTVATKGRTVELYSRLWATPAPSGTPGEKVSASHAQRFAARNGWAPPLAWDDETIDDPAAEPAGTGRKERRLKPGAELVEDVEFLHRTGATPETAAKRLGMKVGSISDAMRRQGRPDLGAWITGWVDNPAEFKSPVRKGASAPRQSSAA